MALLTYLLIGVFTTVDVWVANGMPEVDLGKFLVLIVFASIWLLLRLFKVVKRLKQKTK